MKLNIGRNKPRSWRNSRQIKFSKQSAVLCHTPFTFKDLVSNMRNSIKIYLSHKCKTITQLYLNSGYYLKPSEDTGSNRYLNGDSGLLVLISCENLRFLGWDDCVSWDQLGHHSTNCFDTKGERSNIQKKDICILINITVVSFSVQMEQFMM